MLPSVSFLIPAAAEGDWKLSCFLEFPECMWLYFFQFCPPRLQSTLIPVKHHREAQICQKFTISCRHEVFRQFFCQQKLKIWFQFQTFESNVSFSTRCNSELGPEFAIRWERNRIFRKKSSERVELFFFNSGRFSILNFCFGNIPFAKWTGGHVDFSSDNAVKKFFSNSVNFFSKFEKFSAISLITVVIVSISSWSFYIELISRAHRKHVWHPCCKKVAR